MMTFTHLWIYFLGIMFVRIGLGFGLQMLFQRGGQLKQIYLHEPMTPTVRERVFGWVGPFIDVVLAMGFVYVGLFVFIRSIGLVDFGIGLFVLVVSWVCLVEPLYYGYHVLLHTPFLYRHHHRVHHKARIPNSATAMTFTVLERMTYPILFGIPLMIASFFGYLHISLFFVFVLRTLHLLPMEVVSPIGIVYRI